VEQGQTFVQNSNGTFSIKWITINPREFHFFYAFSSPHKGTPRIMATSISRTDIPISLITSVQTLGQLGPFTVGVVHVFRFSRVGQMIELQIMPPGENKASLRLEPLKQLTAETSENTENGEIYPGVGGLPEVDFNGPVMRESVAYFRGPASNQQKSSRSYVFLRMDDPVVVSVITQAQYISIAGAENFKP
jgi:hypothetical protein